MNETVFNGETFSGDTVLVCPNDGDLDLGVEIDQTVYLEGVYSLTYGVPTLGAGLNVTAGTNPSIKGVWINLGIAESGVATNEGMRIANTSRSWQTAEESPVTGWDQADVVIIAGGMGATGGALAVTPEIRWRDKTDAGSWTALTVSGEVKYAATTALTDNANLTTGNFGTSSGKPAVTGVQGEQEDSGTAGASTSLSADEFTELQVGASLADSDDGHEYAFALFESAAQVGSESAATLKIAGNNFSSDANCVSVYNFESGALTTDSKGSDTLSSYGDPTADGTNYKQGAASVLLDGTGDYYDIADTSLSSGHPLKSATGEGDWSIAYWVRPNETGTIGFLWTKYRAASGDRSFAHLFAGGNDLLSRWGYNSGDSFNDYDTGKDRVVNMWYHVCQTFTASNDNLFVRVWDDDGETETDYGPTALSNTPYWGSDMPFVIGADGQGGYDISANIDELVFFDDVLTPTQCTAIRQGSYSP
ncbi:MAG: LamG domain-containing protein [Planctomycetota bacterium]